MGTISVTGSWVEDSKKSASEAFSEALEAAVKEGPQQENPQREYTVKRSWFQAGGVVGKRMYYVELEISGPDVDGD